MKSMTGYGRGECAQAGFKVTVELSSVNRKQTEVSLYLPREFEPLEPQIRDELNRRVARGKLTARVSLHAAEGQALNRVRLNQGPARAYARELQRLADELGLSGGVSLELVAQAPGVLQADGAGVDASEFWPAVKKALNQGMAALLQMRQREGLHLAKDLSARMAALRQAAARVRRQAPKVVKRYQEQLQMRLKNAGLELAGEDNQRLLQEVVLFADRCDITEELTRLASHFLQFDAALKAKEPVGRMLDFLAQEMHREVNTLGAKANDSRISREVVTMKAELEKFREQVQNVE